MAKPGARLAGVGNLVKKLDRIENPTGKDNIIQVGIVESAKYPTEVNAGRIKRKGPPPEVAAVAAINEFGSRDGKIPSRPFFRNSLETILDSKTISSDLDKMFDPKNPAIDPKRANKLLSDLIAIFQKEIKNPDFPPNAPFTKLQKAGSETANTTPLIDTSLLRRSINAVIKSGKLNKWR